MEALLYCCCGLDVHKDLIEACILRGEGLEPDAVRESFGTTKPELKRLTVWLSQNDCYSVAMESTGVYWKPIFEALELCSEYLENVWVVNANHMRNLPGRKTDVGDAEWIVMAFWKRALFHLLQSGTCANAHGCTEPLSRSAAGMSIVWRSSCRRTALSSLPS